VAVGCSKQQQLLRRLWWGLVMRQYWQQQLLLDCCSWRVLRLGLLECKRTRWCCPMLYI
jgi:hypothetical protein